MTAGRRGGALWLRRAGAVLLWGTVQGVFLAPRTLVPNVSDRFLFPPLVGAVINAIVAAAVHAQLFGSPLRFGFALASGYAAWATRSIWPSVVLHGAYNASLIVLGVLAPRLDEGAIARYAHDGRVFWPALVGVVVCVGVASSALRAVRAVARRRPAALREAGDPRGASRPSWAP